MKKIKWILLAAVCLVLASSSFALAGEIKKFNLFAVEMSGVKMWAPSTIVVNAGDHVELTAVSKIPAPAVEHGLSMPEFKVMDVVGDKPKTFTFTAAKAGIYPFACHLHPAHVGGQLVVLSKPRR